MKEKFAHDQQLNIDEILEDLDTITKMHTRLDQLALQLSDVVQMACESSEDSSTEQTSRKLMELVNILLDRVEMGINKLEHRVSNIEEIRNRLRFQDNEI
jgi:hypothetical protein